MTTRIAAIVVALVFGVGAFLLSPVLWPRPVGGPTPPAELLPLFILISAIEALIFGIGISFIIFGLPLVQRAARSRGGMTWLVYVSIAWALVSWWPHSNLHQTIGANFAGLVLIEYGFHLTLIIASLIVVSFFLNVLRATAGESSPQRA